MGQKKLADKYAFQERLLEDLSSLLRELDQDDFFVAVDIHLFEQADAGGVEFLLLAGFDVGEVEGLDHLVK